VTAIRADEGRRAFVRFPKAAAPPRRSTSGNVPASGLACGRGSAY